MKKKPPINRLVNSLKSYPILSLSVAALFGLAPITSSATSLYWDPNGSGAGVGGAGAWQNGITTLWNTGATGAGTAQAWNNTNLDTAYFGGAAGGAVTVSGGVSTSGLYFTTGGYTLSGGGADAITIKPASATAANLVELSSSATSGVTVDANLVLDTSLRVVGQQAYYAINNKTAQTLTLKGTLNITGSVDNSLRCLTFSQTEAGGKIVFNSSVTTTGLGQTSFRFGYDVASSSLASYYVGGNNSGLTGGNSVDITRGSVYLGNALALGPSTSTVRFANGSLSGNAAKLFTNAAITVANKIEIYGDAGALLTIGGATAEKSTYSGQIVFNNTSGNLLKLTAAQGGEVDFINQITDKTYTNAIEKIGAGKVRYAFATGNTYDGGTTITEGTLLANNTSNSATGTGAVNVGVNGTLGGTGIILPTAANGINVSGFIAPGDGIGNLTFSLGSTTGKVTMATGAGFKFDLGIANADTGTIAAGSSDLLALTGAAAGDFVFNSNSVDFGGTGQKGFYKLFDTSLDASTWTGLTYDSTTGVVTSGLTATNLASGLAGNFIVGTASNGGATGDIYLQVVPEPTTWTMIVGGLGVMTFAQRVRRRVSSAADLK